MDFCVVLSDPLTTITDELEIVGAMSGGAYLECSYGFRPFTISAGTCVTLDRLMIMRGVAPPHQDGGAINNLGTLTVKNGFFLDCVAPGRGAAIYSGNGSVLVLQSNGFYGCSADSGGAVMLRRARSAILTECRISDGLAVT